MSMYAGVFCSLMAKEMALWALPHWRLEVPCGTRVTPGRWNHHTLASFRWGTSRRLCSLPFSFSSFVAFWEQCKGLKILCGYWHGVLLNDVLSNNPHRLFCQVASRIWIVADIPGLWASGSACPLPLCILISLFRWWLRLPWHCRFGWEWAAVCDPSPLR